MDKEKEIEIYKEINRELRFAFTRLSLAFDCILDAEKFDDVDIKRSALRILKRTLEDVKDSINTIFDEISELESPST